MIESLLAEHGRDQRFLFSKLKNSYIQQDWPTCTYYMGNLLMLVMIEGQAFSDRLSELQELAADTNIRLDRLKVRFDNFHEDDF